MRMKPKTVRRLTLLAVVALVLIGGAFSLVFVRKWQSERLTQGFRAKALEAQKQGDYYGTIENAGSFLKRGDQRDPEILLAYAEARLNLQEHDGRHLREAAQFYHRYLEERPDDQDAKRTLLETHNKSGYFPEAAELARTMRPEDLKAASEHDIPVLEQEALALVGAKRFGEADAVIARLKELEPLNAYAALLSVDRAANSDVGGRNIAEIQRWAREFLEQNPGEPVALVTAASAELLSRTSANLDFIRDHLLSASGLSRDENSAIQRAEPGRFTSSIVAGRIVDMFDMLNMNDAAIAVLRDADDRLNDPDLHQRLVRRLWQDSALDEVVRRTESIDAASHSSNPMLLGLRALALHNAGRTDEAKAIADAMAARDGDYRLSTWSKALPLAWETGTPDYRKRVETLKAVVKENPLEPIFQVWLGDSLAALARNDEAIDAWRDATNTYEGRQWVLPRLRSAEAMLRQNRLEEANAEAMQAIRLAPNRAVVGVVFFEIQAAMLQRGLLDKKAAGEYALNVRRLEEQMQRMPNSVALESLRERLIAPQIIFLARSDQREEANEYGKNILESDRPLSQQTVERIALASAAERLDLQEACAKRAASLESGSATVQYSRALDLAASGNLEAGRKLLDELVKQSPDDVGARLALARYLERVGEMDSALQVWRELGGRFIEDLQVQRACLESSAIARDKEFLAETISRYESLAGIDPGAADSTTKLARARALMHGTPSLTDRDQAVGLIASVISDQPRLVQAKRLLASILSYADPSRGIRPDFPRAVGALTDAITIEPSNTSVALELASLLQLQGRFPEAREHLNALASNDALDLYTRHLAAEMLIRQGDFAPVAADTFETIAERLGEETPASVLVALAGIYQHRGDTERSDALYARLAGGAANTVESLYMTARHYDGRGDSTRAQELLSRAKALPGSSAATMDLLQARLAGERGDVEQAIASFEAAAKADPKLEEVWGQYAGLLIRHARYQEAGKVAERGLSHVPGDRSLSVLLDYSKLLQQDSGDPELAALASTLATRGASAEAIEIIAAVRELKQRGGLQNPDAIARLSDRFPRSVPLQLWAVQKMLAVNATRGMALLKRAIEANPTDPEPARFGALLYLQLEQWDELLRLAYTWREREGSRSPDPDIAIARAHFEMRQYRPGIDILQRWLMGAVDSPESENSRALLNIYTRLMVASGNVDEVMQRLTPALRSSQSARIQIGIQGTRDSTTPRAGQTWIEYIASLSDPEGLIDQLVIASMYAELASKFSSDTRFHQEAKRILEGLAARPDATSAVWESLGIIRHGENDLQGAEADYLRAIAMDGSRAVALNNLATLYQERDLDQALEYAQRAVAAGNPTQPGYTAHLDTLAGILARRAERAADPEAAAAQFVAAAERYMEAANLERKRYEPYQNAAECARRGGAYDLAVQAYGRTLGFQLDAGLTAALRNNLAATLLLRKQEGDAAKARDEATVAVQLDPRPTYLDTLGWANLELKSPGDAERAFTRAIEMSGAESPIASARLGLASALADLGRHEDAKLELGKLDRSTLSRDNAERLEAVERKLSAR